MSQVEQVISQLRRRILQGEIPAEERIMEIPVAKDLGVSRTPVRLALSALEQEGLVKSAGSKRGFVVRSFDLVDVFEAIELRGVLEGTAARLLAEQGAKSSVECELKECVLIGHRLLDTGMKNEENQREWVKLNDRLHRVIIEGPGWPTLVELIERINHMPLASPSAITFVSHNDKADLLRLGRVQEDHAAIVDAILKRQGTRAEMRLRDHALSNINNKKGNFQMMKERSSSLDIPGLDLIVDSNDANPSHSSRRRSQ